MDVMATFNPTTHAFSHLGPAAHVAYHPQAPKDEVQDASLEIAHAYADALGMFDNVTQTGVRDLIRLQEAERTGNRMLAKALKMVYPGAESAKARTESYIGTLSGGGTFMQKPGIPFEALRQLSKSIEVAQAIHLTRKRQVMAYAQPSEKDDQKGFRIYHSDPSHKLTPDQGDYIKWLTQFLMNGGREFRPWIRKKLKRKTFRSFLGELVDESLTHDNVVVETIPLRGMAGLDSFYLRDGGTFFLAAENKQDLLLYQSLAGLPEVGFTHEQASLFQRNTSPYLESQGYGRSELEASIDTMNLFMQAVSYTREGMDNNAIPRGILTVFGQFDRRTQETFQAAWASKMRGVKNRFGLPVLFSRNGQAAANFTSTGPQFDEMAFAKFIGFTSSIFCATYGADPKEINLDGFTSGSTSSLSGDDTGERLAASKDRGFTPMMTDVEGFIGDDLLAPFEPSYRIGFTGLDPMEAKAKREREEKVSTINELRATMGMDPHPLKWFGELPADSGLLEAEFKRIEAGATFNEGRKIWGGFDAYPDDLVGNQPLNPTMASSYQSATAPAPPPPDPNNPFAQLAPGQEMPGGDDEAGAGDGSGSGEGGPEDGSEPPKGVHKMLKDAFEGMKGAQ